MIRRFFPTYGFIAAQERQRFYEELADRVEEGIALGRAVKGYWVSQTDNGRVGGRWGRILSEWEQRLNGELPTGGTHPTLAQLSQGYFPDVERAFIHIAETSKGNALPRGLRAAADYSRQAQILRGTSVSVMANVIPWALMAWALTGGSYYAQDFIATNLNISIPYSPAQEQALAYMAVVTYGFWPAITVLLIGKLASKWVLPTWTGPRRRWCDANCPGFVGYAREQGLGLLTALAYLMSSGKSASEGLATLRRAANPWLRHYIDDLHHYAASSRNDIVPALRQIGGHFPTPQMVRHLNEAAKSPKFADRAAEILKREIAQAAEDVLIRLRKLNDEALYVTSIISTLSVILDLWLQTAVDRAFG